MAQRGAVDGWDRPSVVEVTVVPGPRGRPARARAGALRRPGIPGLIAVGVAVGALLVAGGVAMFPGGAARPATAVPARAVVDDVPLSAAAQSYRFPIGCLRITRTRQALVGAIRRRTSPCWRYGVYVTAILRHVNGIWRLALEATSLSCPRIALPAPGRAQLAVCHR